MSWTHLLTYIRGFIDILRRIFALVDFFFSNKFRLFSSSHSNRINFKYFYYKWNTWKTLKFAPPWEHVCFFSFILWNMNLYRKNRQLKWEHTKHHQNWFYNFLPRYIILYIYVGIRLYIRWFFFFVLFSLRKTWIYFRWFTFTCRSSIVTQKMSLRHLSLYEIINI